MKAWGKAPSPAQASIRSLLSSVRVYFSVSECESATGIRREFCTWSVVRLRGTVLPTSDSGASGAASRRLLACLPGRRKRWPRRIIPAALLVGLTQTRSGIVMYVCAVIYVKWFGGSLNNFRENKLFFFDFWAKNLSTSDRIPVKPIISFIDRWAPIIFFCW